MGVFQIHWYQFNIHIHSTCTYDNRITDNLFQIKRVRDIYLHNKYSRIPITRTFKGNRKKVPVIGSSKKIAESKVKNSFYCTVNIVITFNCSGAPRAREARAERSTMGKKIW